MFAVSFGFPFFEVVILGIECDNPSYLYRFLSTLEQSLTTIFLFKSTATCSDSVDVLADSG